MPDVDLAYGTVPLVTGHIPPGRALEQSAAGPARQHCRVSSSRRAHALHTRSLRHGASRAATCAARLRLRAEPPASDTERRVLGTESAASESQRHWRLSHLRDGSNSRHKMSVSVLEAGFLWMVRVLQGPAARHETFTSALTVVHWLVKSASPWPFH